MFIVARSRDTTKRSVDILGLSQEFEKYLKQVMPGISVLTIRFGYFGFICWAIMQGINPKKDEEKFRRIEDALAKTEFRLKSPKYFKGSRNIREKTTPPYYVQSVFSDYRNTMEKMGLLSRENELTVLGKECAKLFGAKVKLPRNLDIAARDGFDVNKSLLELNVKEKEIYKRLFFKGANDCADAKKRAQIRKSHARLYQLLWKGLKNGREDEDYTDEPIIKLLFRETENKKYKAAHEMSKYLWVSYYCSKALHELQLMLNNTNANPRTYKEALKHKPVQMAIMEIQNKVQKAHWVKGTKLHKICSSKTHEGIFKDLMTRHINFKGNEKAWFQFYGNTTFRLNPNNPPVPKDAPSFGIRLPPYISLSRDL